MATKQTTVEQVSDAQTQYKKRVVAARLAWSIDSLRELKRIAPTSDAARYYAISITDIEKALGFFSWYAFPASEPTDEMPPDPG